MISLLSTRSAKVSSTKALINQIRITTACTGDLHWVQLAAAPVSARNAGAVMLQAGRHRASTHKEVDVSAFHARAFAARGNWIVIGTQRVLRFGPYPPHWIIFALAPACFCLRFFVPICDVLCHLLGPTRSRRRLSPCMSIAQNISQRLVALI